MQQLEIKNGALYLDDKKIQCVKKINIASSAEDKGTAELTICMKVRIKNLDETELKQ